ncbi:hypothetical protein OAM67_01885, partial [bacterium]|nr:hypothetical protein [bacterium]
LYLRHSVSYLLWRQEGWPQNLQPWNKHVLLFSANGRLLSEQKHVADIANKLPIICVRFCVVESIDSLRAITLSKAT